MERVIERLQADEAESRSPRACLPPGFLAPSEQPGHLGRIAHYEVLQTLGQGGMCVVLQALDTKLNRLVALKVLAPDLARHTTAGQRFVREAQAAAALHSDHVVAIHSVEEAQGVPYLVMEHIHGVSLQERIDRDGPLPLEDVLRIGMQAAQGLAAAHEMGLVHRDVKPGNLLLEENGAGTRAALADFGLAQAIDEPRLTQNGWLAGTPQYMSPEQARGEAVDARSDLFSLGSVLYAACAGRPPFSAPTSLGVLKQLCDEPAPEVRTLRPDVPDDLAAVIARLHAKEPAKRFQSAAEVGELLRQILAHRQDPSQPRPAIEYGRASRRRWLLAAGIVMALLCGLALTETTGVTSFGQTVIRVTTPAGTFLVDVKDPAVKVTIEGEGKEIVITGADLKEIRVRPGKYRITATKDGKSLPLESDEVVLRQGDRDVVRVRREIILELTAEQKVQQAKKTLEEAKLRQELARCEDALRANPTDRLLLANRAAALTKLDRLDEAIAELSKIIGATKAGEGDFAGAYGARGSLYQQRGEMEKALADYQQRIHLVPNQAWPYGRMAEIYLFGPAKLRDSKKALEAADLALMQPDANLNFHSKRGLCLYRLERYKEAVELLEQTYDKGNAQEGRSALNRFYAQGQRAVWAIWVDLRPA